MVKKRSIRVRLSHQRIEALHDICGEMLESFRPANDHHVLLREYMLELRHNLHAMSARTQDDYTLSLSGTEAVAFYQLWQLLDIKHDKYATVIVETMLKKMSSLAA